MTTLLEDPRIRQTWNQFSQNAEHATESAAAGIWTFQHTYINPCLCSIASAFEQCTSQCFPDREERRARRLRDRGRARGRAELSFDFYDDWDEDGGGGGGGGLLGGWGNDELDRLLAGSGAGDGGDRPPRRKRGMSYGTRGRRKSLDPDPTVIPSTSALGFLGRLPFKLGGTLRYKPSAADLQDHPGALRTDSRDDEEGQPLISDEQDDGGQTNQKNRERSSTTSSGGTSDSFRSRRDLFPSDGEDDAVPLDDEFAVVLERRMAGASSDDRSSGKTRSSHAIRSRQSSGKTISTTPATQSRLSLPDSPDALSPDMVQTPTLAVLQREEERVRLEEDAEVERKRQAATRLAQERGLQAHISEAKLEPAVADASPPVISEEEVRAEILARSKPEAPPAEPVGNGFVPARLPNFG